MVRIVIRVLGVTFVTVSGLSLTVDAGKSAQEASAFGTDAALADLRPGSDLLADVQPLAEPAVAVPEPEFAAPRGDGPKTPIEALRTLLAQVAAEGGAGASDPEDIAVTGGVPSGHSTVRVNRGLP